jgi:hypothetical protein
MTKNTKRRKNRKKNSSDQRKSRRRRRKDKKHKKKKKILAHLTLHFFTHFFFASDCFFSVISDDTATHTHTLSSKEKKCISVPVSAPPQMMNQSFVW